MNHYWQANNMWRCSVGDLDPEPDLDVFGPDPDLDPLVRNTDADHSLFS
jgi:hypothetical protein